MQEHELLFEEGECLVVLPEEVVDGSHFLLDSLKHYSAEGVADAEDGGHDEVQTVLVVALVQPDQVDHPDQPEHLLLTL